MTTSTTDPSPGLYRTAYAIAALLILLPLVEFVLTVWPLRPGQVMWRFGTFGLLTQALILPTLGAFLAIVVAHVVGDRKVQLTLSVLLGTGGLALAAGLVLFVLDAVQARGTARAELQPAVTATTIRAIAATLVYVALWLWIMLASVRSVKRGRAARRRTSGALVGGTSHSVQGAAGPAVQ